MPESHEDFYARLLSAPTPSLAGAEPVENEDPYSMYLRLSGRSGAASAVTTTREERQAAADERAAGGFQNQEPDWYERNAMRLLPAATSLVPAATGLAGVGPGAAAGAALGAFGGPLAPATVPVGTLLGGLLGGLGGGWLGGGAQEEVLDAAGIGEDVRQNLAEEREAEPGISLVSEMAPQLLTGRPSRNLNLLGRLGGAGIGLGTEVAAEGLSDQPFDARRLAANAALGFLLDSPWRRPKRAAPAVDVVGDAALQDPSAYDRAASALRAQMAASARKADIGPELGDANLLDPNAYDRSSAAYREQLAARARAADISPEFGDANLAKGPFIVEPTPNGGDVTPAAEPVPAPVVPPEPVRPEVRLVAERINSAKSLVEETRNMYRQERARRAQVIEAAMREGGPEALATAKSFLSGELPRAEYKPAEALGSEKAVTQIRERIATSDLQTLEKVGANTALERMLDPVAPKAPRPHEIKYFERVYGPELASALDNIKPPEAPPVENFLAIERPPTSRLARDVQEAAGQPSPLPSFGPKPRVARGSKSVRKTSPPTMGEAFTPRIDPATVKGEAPPSLLGGLGGLGFDQSPAAKAKRAEGIARFGAALERGMESPEPRRGGARAAQRPTTDGQNLNPYAAAWRIAGLSRSIPSGLLDMSLIGRQWFRRLYDVKRSGPAIAAYYKQFFGNHKVYADLEALTKNHKLYSWAKDVAGVEFADTLPEQRMGFRENLRYGQTEAARVEGFQDNLAESIPGVGPLFRRTGRAAMGATNKLRMDTAAHIYKEFTRNGEAISPELARDIGEMINSDTGAGSFGKGEFGKKFNQATPALNVAMYSVKLMKSRIDLINPIRYAMAPAPVRAMMVRSFLGTAAISATALGIAKALGAEVETDPTSPEFGKARVGNIRHDFFGGELQYVRFAAQLMKGSYKSSTGQVRALTGDTPVNPSRAKVIGRFIRSKASPLLGMVWNWAEGRDFKGQKTTSWTYADSVAPMFFSDAYDMIKQDGISINSLVGIAESFHGVGVSAYDTMDDIDKLEAKARAGMSQIDMVREAQRIHDVAKAMSDKEGRSAARRLKLMNGRLKSTEEFSRLNQLNPQDLELTLKDKGPEAQRKYADLLEAKKIHGRVNELRDMKDYMMPTAQRNELRALLAKEKALDARIKLRFKSENQPSAYGTED